MIATILPSSTCFHAVGYNERKVAKGSAHLLEMKNFDAVEMMGHYTPDDLVAYLENYSSKNPRINKAQFHMAFHAGDTKRRNRSFWTSLMNISGRWDMAKKDSPCWFTDIPILITHIYI